MSDEFKAFRCQSGFSSPPCYAAEVAPDYFDPLAVDQYLTYGYVPHPRTILQGVHKLPPAHLAVWQDGRLRLQRYWEPDWDVERDRPEAEEIEELRGLLSEAVREQMASDVPLGAFLSGGIDSTIIVGLMQSHSSQRVKTFSIGFDDPAFDERSYAALAAERLGTDHHEFVVRPAAWETLPSLARQFDEPFADSSALPTWHVGPIRANRSGRMARRSTLRPGARRFGLWETRSTLN